MTFFKIMKQLSKTGEASFVNINDGTYKKTVLNIDGEKINYDVFTRSTISTTLLELFFAKELKCKNEDKNINQEKTIQEIIVILIFDLKKQLKKTFINIEKKPKHKDYVNSNLYYMLEKIISAMKITRKQKEELILCRSVDKLDNILFNILLNNANNNTVQEFSFEELKKSIDNLQELYDMCLDKIKNEKVNNQQLEDKLNQSISKKSENGSICKEIVDNFLLNSPIRNISVNTIYGSNTTEISCYNDNRIILQPERILLKQKEKEKKANITITNKNIIINKAKRMIFVIENGIIRIYDTKDIEFPDDKKTEEMLEFLNPICVDKLADRTNHNTALLIEKIINGEYNFNNVIEEYKTKTLPVLNIKKLAKEFASINETINKDDYKTVLKYLMKVFKSVDLDEAIVYNGDIYQLKSNSDNIKIIISKYFNSDCSEKNLGIKIITDEKNISEYEYVILKDETPRNEYNYESFKNLGLELTKLKKK